MIRNHSADRPAEARPLPARKEKPPGSSMVPSSSFSHVSGASAALFNNLRHSSTGAADRLGKAGKGFFGKITRSGSTTEREVIADDIYICSIINLSLVEQTRRTRISKQLESCKDKTEFWMPALPYRCIEYVQPYFFPLHARRRVKIQAVIVESLIGCPGTLNPTAQQS